MTVSNPPMLVDSHCHLDFQDFADDLDGVLARARDAGIEHMLTIGTTLRGFDRVLAIAEKHPNIHCTIGIHPHEAEREGAPRVEQLVEIARHAKIVGIGETGLDYYYDKSPRDIQKRVFSMHVEAAGACDLPLVVHSRNADEDTVRALDQGARSGGLRGVIHCFTSTQYLADAALEMGFYISFSGIVTFKNAEDLRRIARSVPLDRMLVETDAPYLAPVPMRGKRNEPGFVRHTAKYLADLLGLGIEEFAKATTGNFRNLFNKIGRDLA